MRPKRIAMAALGVAAIASPAVTQAKESHEHGGIPLAEQVRTHDPKSYEKQYLQTYDRVAEELGFAEAGRNLVVDGYRENDGDVRDADQKEIVEGTDTLDATLTAATAPETATAEAATTETAATETAVASSATAQCESGGDYTAVDPTGTYYGAYQFQQSTWDAYAPEGYQGVNPAEAPPAVQDQAYAAAAASGDHWPNCP
jgi:Transglycosylase-like domain